MADCIDPCVIIAQAMPTISPVETIKWGWGEQKRQKPAVSVATLHGIL